MAGKSILVVDDSRVQRMIIESSLKPFGFRVMHSENGKHALGLLEETIPDLILLDVEMPVMDGFQTLHELRKLKLAKVIPDIPILFLTIVDKKSRIIEGLDAGADDYIIKPYNRQELISRVNAVLRRGKRLNRNVGEIHGELSNMSLADFMESIENNSRTAEIRMPEINAYLFFEFGNLIHVRQGNVTGDRALSRIFLHNKGAFLIRFNELPGDIPNVPQSFYKALRSVLAILEFDEDEYYLNHVNRAKVVRQIKEALRRVELKAGVDDVMSGYIHDVGLENLMQNMDQGAKTACIRLEDIDGDIYFKNGAFVHARLGNFTGDRALRRMFLLNRGAFTVRYGNLPDTIPGSPQPLMSVLMDALSTVDEVRDTLAKIGDPRTFVDFNAGLPEFKDLKNTGIFPPLELGNLIVLMNGDLKDNLRIVITALENDRLELLPVKIN